MADAKDILTRKLSNGELSTEEYNRRLALISDDKSDNVADHEILISDEDRYGNIGLIEAISLGFKNMFDFQGRSSRSAYWYFGLFVMCAYLLILGFTGAKIGSVPRLIIDIFVTVIPLSASVRRLHDTDRSGWWNLVGLTIIGLVPLIIWQVTPGQNDVNRFGPRIDAGK